MQIERGDAHDDRRNVTDANDDPRRADIPSDGQSTDCRIRPPSSGFSGSRLNHSVTNESPFSQNIAISQNE